MEPPPQRHSMPAAPLLVTSLDGVVHLVLDSVIATCDTGRYPAACGATFIPAALTEPDGSTDCPLCRARPLTQR